MKNIIFITILILLTIVPALFAAEPNSRYEELKARLRPEIEKIMEKNQITGLSLALVDGDRTVWAEGFGYADITRQIPVDERTIFPLASISKLFTGIAVIQLVEEGKIELDSPLSDYIPEFEIKTRFEKAPPLTVRNLLTHHSGLPSALFYPAEEPLSEAAIERYLNFEETLFNHLDDVHLAYPPGYIHSYSNLGYDLLGILVERVSDMSLTEYAAQNIFAPLGMDASFTHIFMRDALGERLALPHRFGQPSEKLVLPGVGSSAANSDAIGMAGFIKMLLGKGLYRGTRVLSEESLARMLTVQNGDVQQDKGVKMGLSFYLSNPDFDYAGGFYGHNGALYNYYSDLLVLPEHELGLFIVCNSMIYSSDLYNTVYKILAEAIEVKSGLTPPPPKKVRDVRMTGEQAKSFKGFYTTNLFGPVELKTVGRRVYMHSIMAKSKMELKMLDSGWLRIVSPIPDFKKIFLKLLIVDGKRQLYMQGAGMAGFIGIEQEKIELEPYWQERVGEYRVVQEDMVLPGYSERVFRLDNKAGMSIFSAPMQPPRPLIPLNAEECIIGGIGRGARETVYFENEDGKTIIKWAGYTLEKVK